jgi:hypothetical protein
MYRLTQPPPAPGRLAVECAGGAVTVELPAGFAAESAAD